ncbi:hypothetical protein [Streptomyces sp. AJS327]|uniref:hypothetical protein n=1 Tax=Streptomyces sp. AJS327 TaxID=2545265 RepID=UPI0027E3DFD1|nr:hypothetical protein [Streptomyces sp. AJS327]
MIASGFSGWSESLKQEFRDNAYNRVIGSTVLSETDRVRVWHIEVPPGERLPAHRHDLDYFWTALRDGVSVQHVDDGTTRRVSYRAGDTRHFVFRDGAYLLHDLVNDGDTPLEFLTVEHLD